MSWKAIRGPYSQALPLIVEETEAQRGEGLVWGHKQAGSRAASR